MLVMVIPVYNFYTSLFVESSSYKLKLPEGFNDAEFTKELILSFMTVKDGSNVDDIPLSSKYWTELRV